jgi:hypothetical protein
MFIHLFLFFIHFTTFTALITATAAAKRKKIRELEGKDMPPEESKEGGKKKGLAMVMARSRVKPMQDHAMVRQSARLTVRQRIPPRMR